MKYIFLNQLFIVIKRKAFRFYYLQKYKIRRGHIWTRLGPHFTGPDLCPIGQGVSLLVWRQTDYPIGATFFPIGARLAPHQNFCTGFARFSPRLDHGQIFTCIFCGGLQNVLVTFPRSFYFESFHFQVEDPDYFLSDVNKSLIQIVIYNFKNQQ